MSAGNFDYTSFDIGIGGFDGDDPITSQWGTMRSRRRQAEDDEVDISDIVSISVRAIGDDP